MPSVELIAPYGMYRVVGVDTFDGTDWVEGDYDTFKEAMEAAKKKGATMLKTYVYDSQGTRMFDAGEY